MRDWRLKQAKTIIAQNYWPESKTYERFLTEKICVPMEWLKESLAERCANIGDVYGHVNHLSTISRDAARSSLEEVLLPTVLFRNTAAASRTLEYLRWFASGDDSLTSVVMEMYDLSHDIMELSNEQDRPISRVEELCEKADSIETKLIRHKASLENMSNPPLQKTPVPLACFLSESLSGILFLKLQLGALESGESIWDETTTSAPLKFSSQLVGSGGNGESLLKSRAIKGYN